MQSILLEKNKTALLRYTLIDLTQIPLVSCAFAFVLGVLTVIGYAPFDYFLIPVLTLTGLLMLVLRQPSATRAMLVAFCFGIGKFGAGVSWIYISLHTYGGMAPVSATLATFLFCAYLSLFPALFGGICWRFRYSGFSFLALFVPAIWVVTEWLRGTLLTGFPWLAVGYSQIPGSSLAGYAPIIGVYGVSALVVFTATMFLAIQTTRRMARIASIAILSIAWVLGACLQQIDWTAPSSAPFRVALLQGNIPQDLKWRPNQLNDTLDTYYLLAKQSDASLIVMPETAMPLYKDQLPTAYANKLKELAIAKRADMIVGIAERILDKDSPTYFNSAVSIGPSVSHTYRKQHLVPFGEYIPAEPLFAWALNILQIPLTDLSPGEAMQPAMQLSVGKVAINICFEDVFGEEIIHAAPEANVLVNMSNLAWFGDSLALPQHLQIAQMRALETGRFMLRATNTGMTAIINERGRILAHAKPHETMVLTGMAQGFTGSTPYIRFGNLPILVWSALCLLFGFRGFMFARGARRVPLS
ncbi:apolipoprotein N-acyltransferase [Herminiimonas aquatilis]|uniref:Apolipoprotein N-acyltransferase n=1 Tax=Herminiimonas aquatilis TaxID=345342 RepID=A0ABW2J6A8_9BURK